MCHTFTRHQAFAQQNGVGALKEPQSFDCSAFCRLSFEHAALLPVIRPLRRKMALKEDGALSGIAVHWQGRQHGALSRITARLREKMLHFRDDGALARKSVHFSDCGALGTIAVH